MEKVAFNSALGRLWRSWRELTRSQGRHDRLVRTEHIPTLGMVDDPGHVFDGHIKLIEAEFYLQDTPTR